MNAFDVLLDDAEVPVEMAVSIGRLTEEGVKM